MFTQKRKYSLFCFVYSDILRDIYSDIFFIRSSEKDKFKTNLSGFVCVFNMSVFAKTVNTV